MATDKLYLRLIPKPDLPVSGPHDDEPIRYLGYSLHMFANPPADWNPGGSTDTLWTIVDDFPFWNRYKVVEYFIEEDITPLYMKAWFANNRLFMSNTSEEGDITFYNLDKIHTDECVDMSYLFRNITCYDQLDLSMWNTSKVEDISYIFNLAIIDQVDISNWDVSKVKNAAYAFADFKGDFILTDISFDSLENAEDMFSSVAGYWHSSEDNRDLKNLIKLVPSNKLNNIRFMFSYNTLKKLDLRHWDDLSKVRDYTGAIQGMPTLKTILASNDWDLSRSKVLDSTMSDTLFYADVDLLGRNGTTYDPSKYGKDMARLDNSEHAGYLSYAGSSALTYEKSTSNEYTYDGTQRFGTVKVIPDDYIFEDITVRFGTDPSCSEGPVFVGPGADVVELSKFINAGTYNSYFYIDAPDHTPDEISDYITIIINKASISGIVSPSALSGLEYNKLAQNLVGAGITPVGEMQYKLGSGGAFSNVIPTGTNAGDYVVYFRVISGDPNYEDYTSSEGLVITISRVDPHFEAPTSRVINFNRAPQDLVSEGHTSEGTFKYSLTSEGPFVSTIPTAVNAGDYKVYFKVEGDNNHNDVFGGPISITLNKVDPTYTAPVADTTLVYNRSAQKLASEGASSEGEVWYALSSEGPWSMTMPTGINAGSYPLHYMIKGDANHNDIGVIILNCDIDKADPTLVPPIGLNLIYNTSEQLLLSEGESSEGTFRYTLTTDSQGHPIGWVTSIPDEINAGDYNVYYKLVGDSNHNDTDPVLITVTIEQADVATYPYIHPVGISTPYTGSEMALASEGHSAIADFKYTLDTDSQGHPINWSNDVPGAISVGDYTVYYKLLSNDSNYKDSDALSIIASILKARPIVTAPVAYDNILFNNSEQNLLKVLATSTGGTIKYSVIVDSEGHKIWTEDNPKLIGDATKTATYSIYYKAFGNSEWSDSVEGVITVTIHRTQEKTIYAKKAAQVVTYDSQFSGLSKVNVINSEGWKYVNGTLLVTSEGTDIDVAAWEKVDLRLATELPRRMVEKTFTSYTISEGVKSIGNYAFQNADQLIEITIPHWIKEIKSEAFKGDTSLTTVIYEPSSEGLKTTGNNTFQDCTALTTVNLPDNITIIGISAFNNTKSLATIDLPDTVTEIGSSAFNNKNYDSQGLQSIILPNSLTTIGSSAFRYTNLETVIIPNSVTSMDGSVFSNCRNLKNVTLSNSLTKISSDVFSNCTSLETIDIPSSITELGNNSFSYSGLKELDLSSSSVNKLNASTFSNCKNLTKLILSSGITNLPSQVLYSHQDLEYLYLPNTINNIANGALFTYNFTKTDGTDKVLTIVLDAVTPPTIPVQTNENGSNNILLSGYGNYIDRAVAAGWRIYVPDEAYDAYVDPSCNWYFYKDLIHKKSEMPPMIFSYDHNFDFMVGPQVNNLLDGEFNQGRSVIDSPNAPNKLKLFTISGIKSDWSNMPSFIILNSNDKNALLNEVSRIRNLFPEGVDVNNLPSDANDLYNIGHEYYYALTSDHKFTMRYVYRNSGIGLANGTVDLYDWDPSSVPGLVDFYVDNYIEPLYSNYDSFTETGDIDTNVMLYTLDGDTFRNHRLIRNYNAIIGIFIDWSNGTVTGTDYKISKVNFNRSSYVLLDPHAILGNKVIICIDDLNYTSGKYIIEYDNKGVTYELSNSDLQTIVADSDSSVVLGAKATMLIPDDTDAYIPYRIYDMSSGSKVLVGSSTIEASSTTPKDSR